MSRDKEKLKTLSILVEATKGKLDFQLNADNGIDSKAGAIIALEGTVAIFYMSIIDGHLNILTSLPIVLMMMSSVLLWSVLSSKEYNTGAVDFFDDTKGYRAMSEYDLLEQLHSDYQSAFDFNNRVLSDKNDSYKKAMAIFSLSIIMIIILLNTK